MRKASRLTVRVKHETSKRLEALAQVTRRSTRELVIPAIPFIIPYRIKDNIIEVLRGYHTSRKWSDGS